MTSNQILAFYVKFLTVLAIGFIINKFNLLLKNFTRNIDRKTKYLKKIITKKKIRFSLFDYYIYKEKLKLIQYQKLKIPVLSQKIEKKKLF